MRDLRHIAKFFYLLADNRFYIPFERAYRPSEEYMAIVRDVVAQSPGEWSAEPNGFWFHVHPKGRTLPTQGWKIHVSATVSNSESILRRVAPVLIDAGVAFKCSVDRNVLSLMGSKGWNRGGSGKFMTIYPTDLDSFTGIIEKLYVRLRSERGPYVLSDKRYKDCRVLYYRYGGIQANAVTEITGLRSMVIFAPDGKPVADQRNAYFSPPEWTADPFPDASITDDETVELKNGRYLVKEAFTFSNTGGVYLALDRESGAEVVVKEARADTAVDRYGVDAVGRLKKEYAILEALADTGIAPKPVDAFDEWEHSFVVEEYIKGSDIREIMLTQSPVLKIQPEPEDSRRFYDLFLKLFRSFLGAVECVHARGIVLGDISAENLKIDPSTYEVRLIDFEGACRVGIDEPSLLYTPGFRNPISGRDVPSTFKDDLYGLAAIMLYTMFPIAAMSSIKPDLYESVLSAIVEDVGWSRGNVFSVINGLSKGTMTSERAIALLEDPPSAFTPGFRDDVDLDWCRDTVGRFAGFLLANMRPEGRLALFPSDPFGYQTNPLGLGFGACGTLYALNKCGFEAPQTALDWLERQLDRLPGGLAPGLLTGTSGMAWCLWELGMRDHAIAMLENANQSPLLERNHSMLYGASGVGMTNLFLYSRTGDHKYLAKANEIADFLLAGSQESERGIHWVHEDKTWLGYGYGQSGVALFFLRLQQLGGRADILEAGQSALSFDLSHAVDHDKDAKSFFALPDGVTLEPYIEEGSAGIAKVAIRYGMLDEIEPILRDAWRKYAVFPGLIFGLGGFVDVFTDAFNASGDRKFVEMSRRPLAGIRDLYLIDYPEGAALPGDGLFRVTCDYATGVAGTMRAIHRLVHLDESDFTLDHAAEAASLANRAVLAMT
ncbi:MAG: class III lanthionine synthetase LanKC [Candidatus Eremiobacteraeota bacterium]|nr:class III lanthionine synthetase LanKC [Candidatus Eremiobacteraeota bacterium]